MNSNRDRLIDALNLVHKAMNSPNAYENGKESTFSALRRGCLDLRRDVAQLEAEEFTPGLIQDAWLFLIELSKARLRRKHAIECINIMHGSPKWAHVLHTSSEIRAKVQELTRDMQNALGFTHSDSPSLGPSTSKLHLPNSMVPLQRKASGIPPSAARTKPKQKRGTFRVDEDSSPEGNALPVESPPIIEPIVSESSAPKSDGNVLAPGRKPVDPPDPTNPNNPFRMDFNPFKEERGKRSFRNKIPNPDHVEWWRDSSPKMSEPWWE